MFVNGEFGHDYCQAMFTYSEMDGQIVSGQQGYLHNKKIASVYKGNVDNNYLAKIQDDYKKSSYAYMQDDIKFYNSTFRFFQDVFYIQDDHYLTQDDIWGRNTVSIIYGFAGDWDSYGNILEDFFRAFSFFIVIFGAQLFTCEKECGMVEVIGTAKHGGDQFLRYKSMAAFCVINILLFLAIVFISIVHFTQYGFVNADVSIQCSMEKTMVKAVIDCNMGQLTIWKIVFGILGCNVLLLIAMLISVLNESSITALAITVISTWILNYSIVHNLVQSSLLDMLLAILPINSFSIETLVKAVTSHTQIFLVYILAIVFATLIILILKKIWTTKVFYR